MFWHIVGRGTGSLSFRPAHPPLVAPILHVSRFTAEPSDSLSSASDRTGLKGTANRDALRWGSICKSRTLFGVRTAMGNGLRTGPSSTFTCSFGCCWSQVLYCFVLYVWATPIVFLEIPPKAHVSKVGWPCTSRISSGPPGVLSSNTAITNRPVYQAKMSRFVRFFFRIGPCAC